MITAIKTIAAVPAKDVPVGMSSITIFRDFVTAKIFCQFDDVKVELTAQEKTQLKNFVTTLLARATELKNTAVDI